MEVEVFISSFPTINVDYSPNSLYIHFRRATPYSEQIDTPNIHFANDQGVVNPACVDMKTTAKTTWPCRAFHVI